MGVFFFFPFSDNTLLCPLTTLIAHEHKMDSIRSGESKLFVAMINTHEVVTSSSTAK